MKNLFISALFLTGLAVGQCATAQTVDDIAKLNMDAMGGAEKIASLKTLKMEGTLNTQGVDVSITSTTAHLKGIRVDIEVMGTSNYQVANTTEGWVYMPVMGMSTAQKMDDDQFKAAQNQMDLQGFFLNYKEKGTIIELAGKDADAYKLNITYKNGIKKTVFIDVKTNRIIKSLGKTKINGEDTETETTMSDYKQNADGYWFPYSVSTIQGTTIYDKISTNVTVDEGVFKN
ncbi:MAG: hypothetical protein IPN43_08940 [Chitinophagaceae bacterium]|nr:hypothetical protein [Chitinophagaceae bacterium]MBK8786606.1 hypothetical protein [Chitinophagaceae bacterium]MBL0200555.1 hypothetical protein [Chitinophagaceae bacterium]